MESVRADRETAADLASATAADSVRDSAPATGLESVRVLGQSAVE